MADSCPASDSDCSTGVRHASDRCPARVQQAPASVRQACLTELSHRCMARVLQVPGRCATGASDKYSAGFRQACVTGVRQVSGVRQELSNRCPAPLRQVPGRCPTGVSDRWPTGVRRPTAIVKQVSDRHGCPIGLNICPTGVQVPTGVRQACLTSGRQASGRRLDSTSGRQVSGRRLESIWWGYHCKKKI